MIRKDSSPENESLALEETEWRIRSSENHIQKPDRFRERFDERVINLALWA
jgi:hypothetical protein